jgi:hypothetical protein
MAGVILGVAAVGATLSLAGGWPSARSAAPGAAVFVRAPLALALGVYQVLFATNALSYVLPIPASFAAGVLTAVAVPWMVLGGLPRPHGGVWRGALATLRREWGWRGGLANGAFAVMVAAAWYLASAAALWQFLWDEPEDHWINVATIAHGNFYPRLAFAPDKALQYHYGFDLLAAVVERLSGVPTWWAIDAITIILAPLLAWLGVALAWTLSGSRAAALLTGTLFFFGGGLRATLLTNAVRAWMSHPRGFWVAIQETPPPLNDVYDPFIWGVHDHNRALATTGMLALALALPALLREPTRARVAVVAVLMGLIALVSETDYVIVAGATAALVALILLPRRYAGPAWTRETLSGRLARRGAVALVAVVAISSLVALLQGGLLSDAVFRNPHDNPQTHFELRWPPGLPRFQRPPLGPAAPGWTWALLSEFGIVLALAPVAAWLALRRLDPVTVWLVAGGAAGIALPALVAYPFLDHDMSRFAVTGVRFFILAAAPAVAAAWHFGHRRPMIVAGARLACLGALAVSMAGPLAIALYLLPPGGGMVARAPELKSGETGVRLAELVRAVTPQRARVLTDIPQELATLTGRMMPSDKTLHSLGLGAATPLYTRSLETLDAEAMRRLGIQYVAITSEQWRKWPPSVQRELVQSGRFLHIASVGVTACSGEWATLYEVAASPVTRRDALPCSEP